jgi:hypothetical protein
MLRAILTDFYCWVLLLALGGGMALLLRLVRHA